MIGSAVLRHITPWKVWASVVMAIWSSQLSGQTVTGHVFTADSRRPLGDVVVIVMGPTPGKGVTRTDSTGRFELSGATGLTISFLCSDSFPLRPIAIHPMPRGRDSVIYDLAVPQGYCDPEPFREVRLTLDGWYRSEFEGSRLEPCPSPSLPRRLWRPAMRDSVSFWGADPWVKWTKRVQWDTAPPPLHSGAVSRWFVRVIGTLRGPGEYGHMGVSQYELEVDSLVTIRTPEADDCATPARERN